MSRVQSAVGEFAFALGKGLIAGLAGTAAITASQMIEMKLSGRKPSTTPADAASKVLDVKAINKTKKEKFAQEVHWTYGTTWGIARSIISLAGLNGFPATLAHFTAIYSTALTIQPALDVAPPVTKWKPKTIATGVVHHLVYAVVAGLVYDAID